MRCSVSPITAGCSCSSFSMKWRKLPLPIAAPVSRVSFTSRCTSAPLDVEEPRALAVDHGPVAVAADRRCAGSAAPAPGRRSRRTSRPRRSRPPAARRAVRRRSARDGRRRSSPAHRRLPAGGTRRRPPAIGAMPRCRFRSTSCATVSVSVSVVNSCPAASSSARSSAWFSMMPLCTTRYARGAVRMGVAFGRRAVRRPARVADAGGAGAAARGPARRQDCRACPRRGGARYGRSPAWRCRRCHSRGIPAGAANPGSAAPPVARR